jgi:acyl dehydratase
MATPDTAVASDVGWEAAWQPLIDAVGTDFGDGMARVGPDVVEAGAIRRFCEVLELGCPLHHDATAARAAGYPDIVAPVSSILAFTIPPMWKPGEPPVFTMAGANASPARTPVAPTATGLEPPSPAYFATGVEMDAVAPVIVGDRLARVGNRLVACVPKQTRVGRGAFMTWESEVHNQRDEVVLRTRNSLYRYEPHRSLPEHRPNPLVGGAPSPLPPPTRVDWSRPRRWTEMAEGQALDPVAFPLSLYRLVVEAGANRDFNPIHHNRDWARSEGAPDVYANTILLQGMWERAIREFIGIDGTIRSITGFRMRSFNVLDDTVVVRGVVGRARVDGDVGLLDVEMWSENGRGTSVGPGVVTVAVRRQ